MTQEFINTMPLTLLGRHIATFEYTNWKGETEVRKVVPDRVVWMDEPDYGYKPGWFLIAWDLKRKAFRQFALTPEHMRPNDSDPMGREQITGHGVNVLLQVR